MIPGITDKTRLPRLGVIRLGEKVENPNGKAYPKALDHYNFTDAPDVGKVYGEGCKELFPVVFPHDDEEIFFPTARKAYRKSGLFCSCSDGQTATRVFTPDDTHGLAFMESTRKACEGRVIESKDERGQKQRRKLAAYATEAGEVTEEGDMFELPCPADECWYMQEKFCKNNGRLLFMLPTVAGFGVWQITTSSYNSMVQVLSMIRQVRSLIGHIAGVPFALVLRPQQAQVDGKAKTIHALSLEYRGTMGELAGIGRRLAAGGGVLALLPESAESIPDDLYSHAGASLDAKLAGLPEPGSIEARLAGLPDQEEPERTPVQAQPALARMPAPPAAFPRRQGKPSPAEVSAAIEVQRHGTGASTAPVADGPLF